jgi:D-sedoheptulose 7-phosphate isomerase
MAGAMNDFSAASAEKIVRNVIQESIEVKTEVLKQNVAIIIHLSKLVTGALRSGKKLVLFGNGGSAADAQHIAAELVNRFLIDRDALAALALTTDTSSLTAVGNDSAFDQIFSRQVQALVQRDDVVVGISTSGNSTNVINGVVAAKKKGAVTVGFTGHSGGELKDLVDVCCHAPSDDTPRVQEAQLTIWHALCEVVEQEMFGR